MSDPTPTQHVFANMKELNERRNQFVDPEHIVLVGLDTADRDAHPLYEKRVHLPVDENLKANIAADGIQQEVTVQKITVDGGGFVLAAVTGRQRVKAARAANVELRSRGMAPIMVPIKIASGEAPKLAGIMVTENELRTQNSPLDRARLMKKLIDLGTSKAELMQRFGATDVTLANWTKMLELHPDVHKMVDAGLISANAALGVATVAYEKQAEKLQAILDKGNGKASGTKVRGQTGTGPQYHPVKPKVLQAIVLNPAAKASLLPAVYDALYFAATGEGLDKLETIKSLMPPKPEKAPKAAKPAKAPKAAKKPKEKKAPAKKGAKAPAPGGAKKGRSKKTEPAAPVVPQVFVPPGAAPVPTFIPPVFVPPTP